MKAGGRGAWIAATAVLIASFPASAYVPPSQFIVEQAAVKRASLKYVRIRTRITGTKNQIKETAWYNSATRELRATIADAQDQSLYQYSKVLNPDQDPAGILVFSRSGEALADALRKRGVPVMLEEDLLKVETEAERRKLERTELGRFENVYAWVVGAGKTALWFVKDEFIPFRFFFEDDGARELRLEENRSTRDFTYPRAITLFRDGEYVLKGEAIEVVVNPSDASGFEGAPSAGIGPLPEGLDEPTQELIRDWIKWLR